VLLWVIAFLFLAALMFVDLLFGLWKLWKTR
jgi:hypothetical protein